MNLRFALGLRLIRPESSRPTDLETLVDFAGPDLQNAGGLAIGASWANKNNVRAVVMVRSFFERLMRPRKRYQSQIVKLVDFCRKNNIT